MSLAAPYYVYRPSQILRRLVGVKPPIRLPWGDTIDCDPEEGIGRALVRNGVFELGVTEWLWRLTDAGDLCVDAGANIGYMTSVMARRAGPSGLVMSFEPHVALAAILIRNALRWNSGAPIEIHSSALSDADGNGVLTTDHRFAGNHGTAFIGSDEGQPVPLERLDRVLGQRQLGVLKVDVEGHELAVFRGARQALIDGRIRDIVYEDLNCYPSGVSRFLEDQAYRVFGIQEALLGPRLTAPETPPPPNATPNYVATRDPERLLERAHPRGWQSLTS